MKKTKLFSYPFMLGILAAVVLIFNPWIEEAYRVDRLLFGVYLFCCLFLVLSYHRPKNKYLALYVISYLFLVMFQITTTEYKNEYQLTPYEANLQIQRMNQFPPRLAKLGYILETKKQMQTINSIERNFFNILDFDRYFPSQFRFVSLPILIWGSFIFMKSKNKVLFGILAFSVILLTFIGVNGKLGPFVLYPYFILFIHIAISNLVRS